jgi:multidrug efflux pump subunit AcrB
VVLYLVVPKGFFPVQDTGADQGISEADQSISFAAMAERQQALASACCKTRRCKACRPSSAWMAPTPRSTPAAC